MKQLAISFTLAVFLAGAGAGVAYFVGQSSGTALTTPAMAAVVAERPDLELVIPDNLTGQLGMPVRITGKTLPNIPVVIFCETYNGAGKSDESGMFGVEVMMQEGLNNLTVTAIDSSGREKTLYKEVTFRPIAE